MSARLILATLFPVEQKSGPRRDDRRERRAGATARAIALLLLLIDGAVDRLWRLRLATRRTLDRAIAHAPATERWISRASLLIGCGLIAMMLIRVAAALWQGRA